MNVIMPYIAVTIVIISVAFLIATTTIVVIARQRIATQVNVDCWLPSSTDIIITAAD